MQRKIPQAQTKAPLFRANPKTKRLKGKFFRGGRGSPKKFSLGGQGQNQAIFFRAARFDIQHGGNGDQDGGGPAFFCPAFFFFARGGAGIFSKNFPGRGPDFRLGAKTKSIAAGLVLLPVSVAGTVPPPPKPCLPTLFFFHFLNPAKRRIFAPNPYHGGGGRDPFTSWGGIWGGDDRLAVRTRGASFSHRF